jgi:hypothetical protein
MLRRHRELIRPALDLSGHRPRQGLDPEVVELVLRLAQDNERWGYPRIAGEWRRSA